jgi:hypothetical protein
MTENYIQMVAEDKIYPIIRVIKVKTYKKYYQTINVNYEVSNN